PLTHQGRGGRGVRVIFVPRNISYSGFQMSVYSFENKKSVPLRVLSFHFAVGKMKTTIWCDRLLSWQPQVS
ncbi:MAG: hypothetical protein ACK58Z_00175, partial [Pseudanabaena sp.]